VAIAFGVYAVRSVAYAHQAVQQAMTANQYAEEAVQQAMTANQLAILAVCLSNGTQVGHVENPFRFREETH